MVVQLTPNISMTMIAFLPINKEALNSQLIDQLLPSVGQGIVLFV